MVFKGFDYIKKRTSLQVHYEDSLYTNIFFVPLGQAYNFNTRFFGIQLRFAIDSNGYVHSNFGRAIFVVGFIVPIINSLCSLDQSAICYRSIITSERGREFCTVMWELGRKHREMYWRRLRRVKLLISVYLCIRCANLCGNV